VASFPTGYRNSGLSEVMASRIAFATSDGCIAFCTVRFNDSDILIFIWLHGESADSDGFVVLAVFIFFQKLELTAPGSISMILIPNGSNSYCIDSDRHSRANLVP
jgi:hypothetical protein